MNNLPLERSIEPDNLDLEATATLIAVPAVLPI
jgi:hypothetical protein